tara:strand:- start:399 stop:896 length:498 start_codon:yes stop_codon:yes gene_type:complete
MLGLILTGDKFDTGFSTVLLVLVFENVKTRCLYGKEVTYDEVVPDPLIDVDRLSDTGLWRRSLVILLIVGISIGGGIVGGGGGGGEFVGLFKFVVNDCVVVGTSEELILEFVPRIPAGSNIAMLDLLCLILVVVLIGVDSSSSFEFMLFSEFIVSDKLSNSESFS